MNPAELQAAARRQLDDYDRRNPGSLFAEGAIAWTLDDAYRVQSAVAALREQRGEAPAGFKIGCVSSVIRKQLGIAHPVVGCLFASEIHESGAVLPASRFDGLAVEGEFAVRIAEDVPDAEAAAKNPERYAAGLFPVIELHNARSRLAKRTAVEIVANNALHAGIVVAPPAAALPLRRACPLSVRINGELRGKASADPSATLPELVERLAVLGKRLKKGQIALTGSPLPLYPLAFGDTAAAGVEGAPFAVMEVA